MGHRSMDAGMSEGPDYSFVIELHMDSFITLVHVNNVR